MPHKTETVRVRYLTQLSGLWPGDVVDLDRPSAEWLAEEGLVEPAPDADLTTGGRAFTRPELLADPEPTPRSRRSA